MNQNRRLFSCFSQFFLSVWYLFLSLSCLMLSWKENNHNTQIISWEIWSFIEQCSIYIMKRTIAQYISREPWLSRPPPWLAQPLQGQMSKLSNYLSLTRFAARDPPVPPPDNWITDKLEAVLWYHPHHHPPTAVSKFIKCWNSKMSNKYEIRGCIALRHPPTWVIIVTPQDHFS